MLGYVEADALGGVGFSTNGGSAEDERGIEPFRILRSNLEFLAPERDVKTVAITSPVAEEGKSTVAAGLASAAALAGKRVLLVECDLRRPVFAERFDVPRRARPHRLGGRQGEAGRGAEAGDRRPARRTPTTGAGRGRLDDAVAPPLPLTVIPAGSWAPRPAELLGSERFQRFLDQVAKAYDLVICDCAPLLPVGDTLEVIPQVDAALICIRLDQTTQEQALAAKAAIEHFPRAAHGRGRNRRPPGARGLLLRLLLLAAAAGRGVGERARVAGESRRPVR